jgi:hypothetical protein
MYKDFKLRFNFNHLMYLGGKYAEFFRQFKYREYITIRPERIKRNIKFTLINSRYVSENENMRAPFYGNLFNRNFHDDKILCYNITD